jgi:predicted HicB family RNase H-like nuclease
MEKFMLSLSQDSMRVIVLEAERRGVSVQELIRAVIIPDWLHENVRKD